MKFIPKVTNVSALQFFQLIRYAVLILIGVFMAKSGISQEGIGHYETFMMLAGAFSFFWVQGIMKALMPMVANEKEERKPIIIFNVFFILCVLSMVAAALMLGLNKPFSGWLLNGQSVPLPVLLAFYILISSPSFFVEYIYLIQGNAKANIVYGLALFLLQVILVGLPPVFGLPIEYSLFGLTILSAIRFLWVVVLVSRHGVFRIDIAIQKEILRYSTPLIFSTLLSSSAQYIDGFIITSKFSQADFAMFRYGARELPLALLLANSLTIAMIPRFAQKDLRSPLSEMKSEVYRLGLLLFPLSIILLFLSHWAFPVVFNAEFEGSATIFNVYLLLVISRLLFPQAVLMGQRMNRSIVMASVFEVIINTILSIWFANIFGIVGVAYATFVAYLFEKIYLTIVVIKEKGIYLRQYLPVVQYVSFSIILVVAFVIIEFLVY